MATSNYGAARANMVTDGKDSRAQNAEAAANTSVAGASGNNNNDSNNNQPSWPGMFNFQDVMDKFYNYEPGEDDEVGRSIKNTFQSNMIQSAFDKEMSKEMGEFQNALGQSNMQMAANLELANNSSMMQQEFNYGMQSMGAQFDFQNEFANAQYDRDVGMLAATGEDTRKTMDNQGYNQRLQTVTEGEQARLSDTNRIQQTSEANKQYLQVQGGEQRLIDTNQSQNRQDELKVQGTEQRLTDASKLRVAGEEERASRKVDGSETRLTDTNRITTTAAENRNTMDFANRLEAKTRADQSKYSRSTARGF